MEWPKEMILRLRQLWDEGHSTNQIGRMMGLSKNAVVGKAHRLDLPPRPNPVQKENEEVAQRRKTVKALRLRGMQAIEIMGMLDITRSQYETAIRLRRGARLTLPAGVSTLPVLQSAIPIAAEVVPMPPAKPPPAPILSDRTCSYPTNSGVLEDGRKGWTFCDQRAVLGRSYCAEHQLVCTRVVRDRREDAAA